MSNWEGGSTRQWRRVRALVLTRDGYQCRVQGEGCTTRATCVHHVHGREVTGDDPRYLVASCDHCNTSLGSPSRHDPPSKPFSSW